MKSAFGVEHDISKKLKTRSRTESVAGHAAMGAGLVGLPATLATWNKSSKAHAAALGAGALAGGAYGAFKPLTHPKKKVSKSYIPGKGYVAATDLSRAGKKALREHVEYRTRYRGNAGSRFQEAAKYRKAKGRKLWEGFRTDFQRKVNVSSKPNQLLSENPDLAGYARANGRGGGTIKVNPNQSPADRALTIKHEQAHLTPKRNIWRLHQRTNDPIRMGGEEGRADFIAHGGRSKGAYPGNIAFQRGYNKVQRKMEAAQKRKLA